MRWQTDTQLFIDLENTRLEARVWGAPPEQAPTIVLLHEGLGSCQMWRDLPEQLVARTGAGVFAYSRAGYGASDPPDAPLSLDFLEVEARDVLPRVLEAAGFERGILLGHSDGGSIAAAYLGQMDDPRITGACLIAPHFFTEPGGLAAIKTARQVFASQLRDKLARHHRDVDAMFANWSDAWGHPDFAVGRIEDLLPQIRVPVLAIQGRQDQYGTLAQIETLRKNLPRPPELAVIENCGHAPHLEKPAEVQGLLADFINRAL